MSEDKTKNEKKEEREGEPVEETESTSKINGDEKNKEEEKPGPSSEGNPPQKILRFQISKSVISDESFSSALSYTSHEGEDEYEDFSEYPTQTIHHKFVYTPLSHAQPRKVSTKIPAFSETFVTLKTSSRHLPEILGSSPSPSHADLLLIRATYMRRLDEVKEAINEGADVNTFADRETPLLIATEIGDHRLVAYLLTVPNINPDFQNSFGQTSLTVAIRNGFIKIARLLLHHNADVNIPDHMGKSPLHEALFQQQPSLVKLLLAYGADVEMPDCFGERPIYTAVVKKRHLDCLYTLLKMGAAVNYINITGIPLLSRAIMNGTEFAVIEALIQYGASVNAPDLISKKTPLHFAVLQNDLRVAKFLINHGADLNLRTVYNFTPFDEAIFQRCHPLAVYLKELMNRNIPVHQIPTTSNKSTHTHKKKHGLKGVHKKKSRK